MYRGPRFFLLTVNGDGGEGEGGFIGGGGPRFEPVGSS